LEKWINEQFAHAGEEKAAERHDKIMPAA
jgi:hypothetical protein